MYKFAHNEYITNHAPCNDRKIGCQSSLTLISLPPCSCPSPCPSPFPSLSPTLSSFPFPTTPRFNSVTSSFSLFFSFSHSSFLFSPFQPPSFQFSFFLLFPVRFSFLPLSSFFLISAKILFFLLLQLSQVNLANRIRVVRCRHNSPRPISKPPSSPP